MLSTNNNIKTIVKSIDEKNVESYKFIKLTYNNENKNYNKIDENKKEINDNKYLKKRTVKKIIIKKMKMSLN